MNFIKSVMERLTQQFSRTKTNPLLSFQPNNVLSQQSTPLVSTTETITPYKISVQHLNTPPFDWL